MNVFGVVGQIVARDRKGRSILLTVRYGKPQRLTKDAVQFVGFARVRVPPHIAERAADEELEKGAVVSIQGRLQGVVHIDEALGTTSLVNELVVSYLIRTQVELDPDAAMLAAEDKNSKGQGVYLKQLNEQADPDGEDLPEKAGGDA